MTIFVNHITNTNCVDVVVEEKSQISFFDLTIELSTGSAKKVSRLIEIGQARNFDGDIIALSQQIEELGAFNFAAEGIGVATGHTSKHDNTLVVSVSLVDTTPKALKKKRFGISRRADELNSRFSKIIYGLLKGAATTASRDSNISVIEFRGTHVINYMLLEILREMGLTKISQPRGKTDFALVLKYVDP